MVQRREKSKAKQAPTRAASRNSAAGRAKALSEKATRHPNGQSGGQTGREDEAAALSRRVAELERELAAARQRVADLESLREQALNRIDWAIDSLQNVLDGEA